MSNCPPKDVLLSAPPPYYEQTQGQHDRYGFSTNVGQPSPQGPYPQPGAPPPGYGVYQPDYHPPQPGYSQPGYVQPQPGFTQPGYVHPQPGYVHPQPGYAPPSQPGYPPASSQPGYSVPSVTKPGQTQTVTVQPQGNAEVVIVGGCPNCRTGVLEDNYTMLGVCCAIVFFPIGILCCLAMKEKKCQHCNSTF